MTQLPSGDITFLFTDIEGSTRLWEEDPEAMRQALTRHDTLLRDVIESSGGHVFKTTGDGFCAVFSSAAHAAQAALTAQLALGAWGPVGLTAEAAPRGHPAQRERGLYEHFEDGPRDPKHRRGSRTTLSDSSFNSSL